MTNISTYVFNTMSDVTNMDAWLGKNVDAIQLVGGYANWDDWLYSPSWIAGQLSGFQGEIKWSIGLIPWGASLADAGKGTYDDKYTALARSMLADAGSDDQIYVRVGWEMNGNGWFPWSANGKEGDYVAAFQHFVDAFRSVSDKFVFEWTPNIGDMGMNPELAYPGDKYVDVIGMDFYYNTQWDPTDPNVAWNWFVNERYGLQWQQDFAAAHGKPTAVGEWGVNSDTSGPFIEMAAQWFQDHNMLYHNYWNSNADFSGQLSAGQYPDAGAAFQAIFGGSLESYANSQTAAINRSGGSGVDEMVGHGGNDTLSGNDGNDWLHGYAGNDVLNGGNGDDVLDGSVGDDTLNGGAGIDLMTGGAGNDIYYVDNAHDKVVEFAGEGTDIVYSSIDFSLEGTAVENLSLTGTGNLSATGNELDNLLTGNSGNNVLDGHQGADTMIGGTGNDTYMVDNVGDHIVELAGQGTDRVFASVSYSLAGQSVENIALTGHADINATGNELTNTLVGNAGNNVLDGGAGADWMIGGKGDDIYYFDNVGDHAIENAAEGNDTIYASVSYTLANSPQVENLHLLGSANLNALGSAGDNVLVGNDGNNTLYGKGGNDTLTGGAGSDSFWFAEKGHSTITDFGHGDTVGLSSALTSGTKVMMMQNDQGVLISAGADFSVELVGVTMDHVLLSKTGYVFIDG